MHVHPNEAKRLPHSDHGFKGDSPYCTQLLPPTLASPRVALQLQQNVSTHILVMIICWRTALRSQTAHSPCASPRDIFF
eukprot:3499485-Rhodomonas_salina.1